MVTDETGPVRGLRQAPVLPEPVQDVVVEIRSVDDPEARPWPPELQRYADEVAARLGPFTIEAPTIELVDAAGMSEQMGRDIPDLAALPDDVAEAVRRFDDAQRALGITSREFDVLASNRETAAVIEGVYDQTRHRILLQLASLDSALPPRDQQLLVHEVVHAWQGPARVRKLASIALDQTVAFALIEGEAERVARSWASTTFGEDLGAIEATSEEGGQAASLIADVLIRYELGVRLHDAIDRSGGIDARIGSGAAIHGTALVDPYGWAAGALAPPTVASTPAVDTTPLPEITPPS